MNKIKWLGIFMMAGGLCVLGYQGIESIMAEGAPLYNYTLVDMFGNDAFAWHSSIPVNAIGRWIDYIITMPAYGLLLIVGGVFLIINGIFAK